MIKYQGSGTLFKKKMSLGNLRLLEIQQLGTGPFGSAEGLMADDITMVRQE